MPAPRQCRGGSTCPARARCGARRQKGLRKQQPDNALQRMPKKHDKTKRRKRERRTITLEVQISCLYLFILDSPRKLNRPITGNRRYLSSDHDISLITLLVTSYSVGSLLNAASISSSCPLVSTLRPISFLKISSSELPSLM